MMTSSLNSFTATENPSRKAQWTGRILSGLAVLFLTFDAIGKLMVIAPVVEGMAKLGYPIDTARPLGVVLLLSALLYAMPRTAALGAVLLTGYLGGAVASHVRIGDPLFSHALFPIYVGALIWGGLFLRDRRVRSLLPVRTP